ncbi:MAG TPA: head-tail connector protein [Pseudoneobacillus sp.]|nr:head-tail connector protein [Pseudoneobacillus sp.]
MALTSIKITELELGFVKDYLKVDYTDEDNLISALTVAAQSYINTMLGYKVANEWTVRDDIPDELTVAALMIIAHWYDNRQIQQAGTLGEEIKFAVSAIIDAYKRPLKEY